MKENKQISVEEYKQLRKEVINWQIAIILFGVFIFVLGGLLIAQGSRYFILMYASIAIMFGMASIGLFPLSRIVQSCDKANPNLRKLKLNDVKIPSHYRNKRLLILGIGFILVLFIFANQFDFERGLNKPERAETPTLIESSTSSLIDDAKNILEEDSNE